MPFLKRPVNEVIIEVVSKKKKNLGPLDLINKDSLEFILDPKMKFL
jgi:hypothetical protein